MASVVTIGQGPGEQEWGTTRAQTPMVTKGQGHPGHRCQMTEMAKVRGTKVVELSAVVKKPRVAGMVTIDH